MSLVNIEHAMITAFTDNFSVPVKEEVKKGTPPFGEWVRLSMLPVSDDVQSMGVNGYDQHIGIMQVDLNQPKDRGSLVLLQRADELRAVFYTGRRFDYAGQTVRIVRSEHHAIRKLDDKTDSMPVSITYQATTVRP